MTISFIWCISSCISCTSKFVSVLIAVLRTATQLEMVLKSAANFFFVSAQVIARENELVFSHSLT
eukprot:CAMPEP_0182511244 /NCGR_PEP_ID=MMETSP1321-20130603/30174_1 /TAXON_ID=91990 /ORGANISM="Bolidomonas sp., Strain RCC1657" /LENGTH=64 /DNA_ID=CAMNT_0024717847 /DNA_START=338 /DNA_END=532 /DNA_ORIENTATION=+